MKAVGRTALEGTARDSSPPSGRESYEGGSPGPAGSEVDSGPERSLVHSNIRPLAPAVRAAPSRSCRPSSPRAWPGAAGTLGAVFGSALLVQGDQPSMALDHTERQGFHTQRLHHGAPLLGLQHQTDGQTPCRSRCPSDAAHGDGGSKATVRLGDPCSRESCA